MLNRPKFKELPDHAYEKLAMSTCSETYIPIDPMLDHAASGLCTEAGEIQDVVKRAKFYGTPIDDTNLLEEVGDILWYCALLCKYLGTTIAEAQAVNIAKLTKRYPEKFTQLDAQERDLDAERAILDACTKGVL